MAQINTPKTSVSTLVSEGEILSNAVKVISTTLKALETVMGEKGFRSQPLKDEGTIAKPSIVNRPPQTPKEKEMRLNRRRQYNSRAGIVSSETANV